MAFLRALPSFFVLALGLTLTACNCGEVPPDPPPPPANLACTPDAELIAENRECRRDDQCPCGTHCERGLCASSCTTSADCGEGLSCDGFGRCRGGDLGKQVIARNNSRGGRPRIVQGAVARGDPDEPRLVTVVADEAPIDSARVVADPGTEVAVAEEGVDPEDLDYSSEVLVEEPIEEGEAVNLYVRTTEEDDPALIDEQVNVTVITEDNKSTSVGVVDLATINGLPPVTAPALEGLYEGFAQMTLTGVSSGLQFNGAPPERNVSTLLSAEVFPASGDRAIFVITDPLRLLHPDGQWVGEIVLGDDPRVEMPPFEQLPVTSALASQIQVVGVASNGRLLSDPQLDTWPGTLGFKLKLQFVGASDVQNAPTQIWELGFSRAGDLGASAVAPPVDAAPTLVVDPNTAARTPLPREAAFLEAINDLSAVDGLEAIRRNWLNDKNLRAAPFGHVCMGIDSIDRSDRTSEPNSMAPEVFAGGFPIGFGDDDLPGAQAIGGGVLFLPRNTCNVDADCINPFNDIDTCNDAGACVRSAAAVDPRLTQLRSLTVDEFKSKSGNEFAAWLNAPIFSRFVDAVEITSPSGVPPPLVSTFITQLDSESTTSFTLNDGTTLPFAIPCEILAPQTLDVFVASSDPPPGYDVTFDPSDARLDICEVLAAQYECELLEIETLAPPDQLQLDGFSFFRVDIEFQCNVSADCPENGTCTAGQCKNADNNALGRSWNFSAVPDGAGGVIGSTVKRVCAFPTTPASCVEATLCDDASDSGDLGLDVLGSTLDPISGDLRCEDGGAGVVQPMDLTERLGPDLLADCKADLEALQAAPPTVTGTTSREKLDSIGWDGGAACLDAQRFLTQLAIAGTSARDLGAFTTNREVDTSDAIFVRLLQRYLQTLSFITGDALAGAALAADEAGAGGGLPILENALVASTEGWNLVLHPRIGSAIAGLSGSALADPDYRLRLLDAAPLLSPQHTQPNGAAVSMMELLASQMELLQEIIDRHARAGAREAPDSVADALRVIGLVEAQATSMVERARAAEAGVDPRWLPRFLLAKGRFETARARAFLSLNAAVRGSNPLGIEEDDLPLYFNEIRTDAGSRFSAISQFILGDGPGSNAPAPSAVRGAEAAFDVARASRQAEAERQINVENNEADFQVAKAAARSDLGALVRDYCGPTYFGGASVSEIANRILEQPNVSPLDGGGAVDFETCWRLDDPVSCPAQKEVDAAFDDQRAVERGAERAELIRVVETNMNNSLCVAALTPTQVRIPAAERCREGVDFTIPVVDVVKPLRACIWEDGESPLESFARAEGVGGVFDICAAPAGNDLRPTASSPALAELQRRIYDRYERNPAFPQRAATFIADGITDCSGIFETVLSIPELPLGSGENFCTNGPAGLGLFPEVIFTPGEPATEDNPAGVDSKITLRCDPVLDPGNLIEVEVIEAALNGTENPLEVRQFCDGLFPPEFLGFKAERRNFQVTNAFCFRGSLGAEAATLTTLNGEIEAANAEAGDIQEAFSIAQNSCRILARGNAQLNDAEQAFADEIGKLRAAKAAMDSAAAFAGAAKDCLATASGLELSPQTVLTGSIAVNGGLVAAACATGALEAGFETASIGIDAAMGDLEDQHEVVKLAIATATEEKRCFTEAESELVGLQTQRLRIQIALQEMQNGLAAFVSSSQQAEGEFERALADIQTADDSLTLTVNADPLLGRDQERLRGAMRLARRNAFLAVRAVEYEFQQTLSDRGAVLLAENPDQLADVLDNLRSLTLTGSPNGNRPSDLTAVFSMRQHLLQLAGTEAGVPDTEQQLTDEDRFRMLLLDPRFEVFENGEFVGREIPFQIAPLGELNLGETAGVPIVADNSCAERLFSVNVSILGDPDRMFTGFAPLVNLEVRKRNTFYANFCAANDEPFQVASTRPSKNLFREPGVAEGFSIQGGSQTDLLSKARIQALLNIEPGEFITDAFVDGASTELAGRLLFGDYTLFIPASSIAAVDEAGEPTGDGLLLSEIDDVAIRLDYLSVAR